MLQSNRSVVLIGVAAVLLAALTACANSPTAKEIEQSLAADPKLSSNPVSPSSQQASSNQQQQINQATVKLPADFPKDVPLYPNANLQEVTPPSDEKLGASSTRWTSIDPSNIIAGYYLQELPAKNWQIVRQSNEQGNLIEARQDRSLLKISIQPKTVTNTSPNLSQTLTEILIDYQPNSTEITQATPSPSSSPETTATAVPQPSPSEFLGPVRSPEPTAQPNPTEAPTNTTTSNPQEFSDLTKAPQEFQRYIRDLAALGVLSVSLNAAKSDGGITTNQFEPNKIISRREYARWLVTANNNMYANDPAKQIRLASGSSQPVFSDVPKTDPDFPVIQGLAEAGLIPSPLSGNATAVLFRPGAPLTREQLILWKVPLDTRQALPKTNLAAIEQTWGFQDAGKIDPRASQAILADHQSGEKSNIRRVIGYTTLFQPKKPVTRAEAAATLWYFGTQSEGISADEALKIKRPSS